MSGEESIQLCPAMYLLQIGFLLLPNQYIYNTINAHSYTWVHHDTSVWQHIKQNQKTEASPPINTCICVLKSRQELFRSSKEFVSKAAMAPSSTTTSPALALLVLFIWVFGAHCTSPLEMAECGAQLLLLAPCAPFVQGLMPAPVKSCCDDLVDLNSQQPQCLCLVLNGTSSFPINQTLALRLPPLCGLNADTTACPGTCVLNINYETHRLIWVWRLSWSNICFMNLGQGLSTMTIHQRPILNQRF